jgi:hypothetical protein
MAARDRVPVDAAGARRPLPSGARRHPLRLAPQGHRPAPALRIGPPPSAYRPSRRSQPWRATQLERGRALTMQPEKRNAARTRGGAPTTSVDRAGRPPQGYRPTTSGTVPAPLPADRRAGRRGHRPGRRHPARQSARPLRARPQHPPRRGPVLLPLVRHVRRVRRGSLAVAVRRLPPRRPDRLVARAPCPGRRRHRSVREARSARLRRAGPRGCRVTYDGPDFLPSSASLAGHPTAAPTARRSARHPAAAGHRLRLHRHPQARPVPLAAPRPARRGDPLARRRRPR